MRGGSAICSYKDIVLALFPDSPHIAYVVLTFELACAKSTAERLKVNIIYATWGESGNEANIVQHG